MNAILKSVFVLLAMVLPIIFPQPIPLRQNIGLAILMPMVVGFLLILSRMYIRRRTFGEDFEPPRWNAAIFNFKEPLQLFHFLPFFQFLAFALIGLGLGLLFGTYFKYDQTQAFGLGAIGMGLGMLAGIQIGLRQKSNS
ncbi:MAG: hypothetical protein AB8H47_17025 [Bacteroidia bacterium]